MPQLIYKPRFNNIDLFNYPNKYFLNISKIKTDKRKYFFV